MTETDKHVEKSLTMPVGVVLRRSPGVTKWAKWSWKAVAVIPGAGPAGWRIIREEDGVTEFHAATVPLELHASEVGSYRTSLMMDPPSLFVVLDTDVSTDNEHGIDVHVVTASADIAGDYTDSAEVIVEPVPMPDGLTGTVRDFCEAHFKDVAFKKRRRDKTRVDRVEDGIGDPRIRQTADVFRSPGYIKAGTGSCLATTIFLPDGPIEQGLSRKRRRPRSPNPSARMRLKTSRMDRRRPRRAKRKFSLGSASLRRKVWGREMTTPALCNPASRSS